MPRKTTYPWVPEGQVIKVETPEQAEVELRIASFASRLVAAVLDYLILLGILLVLYACFIGILILTMGLDLLGGVTMYVATGLTIVTFLLQTFYFVLLELRNEGQTHGKRIVGIRTVMVSGHGLTVGGSLIRNLARIVDASPILWIIPGLDPQRRRIGDFLAGTVVVQASPAPYVPPPISRPTYGGAVQNKFHFPAAVREKVSPDDIDLLEHFFHRLPGVTHPVQRQGLIRDLARRYRDRLEMAAAEVDEDPRRFLEELYFYVKDRFERSL